uniref:Uncharacterized protein n=1 Tax=Anguilla anguilla TaxID=7936 RepID=A0A0E9PCH2_ANGAN
MSRKWHRPGKPLALQTHKLLGPQLNRTALLLINPYAREQLYNIKNDDDHESEST